MGDRAGNGRDALRPAHFAAKQPACFTADRLVRRMRITRTRLPAQIGEGDDAGAAQVVAADDVAALFHILHQTPCAPRRSGCRRCGRSRRPAGMARPPKLRGRRADRRPGYPRAGPSAPRRASSHCGFSAICAPTPARATVRRRRNSARSGGPPGTRRIRQRTRKSLIQHGMRAEGGIGIGEDLAHHRIQPCLAGLGIMSRLLEGRHGRPLAPRTRARRSLVEGIGAGAGRRWTCSRSCSRSSAVGGAKIRSRASSAGCSGSGISLGEVERALRFHIADANRDRAARQGRAERDEMAAREIAERLRLAALHAEQIGSAHHVDIEKGAPHQEVGGLRRDVLGELRETLCGDDAGEPAFAAATHQIGHGAERDLARIVGEFAPQRWARRAAPHRRRRASGTSDPARHRITRPERPPPRASAARPRALRD